MVQVGPLLGDWLERLPCLMLQPPQSVIRWERQKLSVQLSTLFRFGLGSFDDFQSTIYRSSGELTLLVLLDVEPSQQHDSLFAQQTSMGHEWPIYAWTASACQMDPQTLPTFCLLGMNRQHSAGAAKSIVRAPEINGPDHQLP